MKIKTFFPLLAILIVIASCNRQKENPFFENRVVLESNSEVAAYAIPNIVSTPNGTILCLSTARYSDSHDWGNIQEVCLIRSLDDGESWEEPQTIAAIENWTVRQTSAIVDPESGKIMVLGHKSPLFNTNGERMTETWKMEHPHEFKELGASYFYVESFDEGATWSKMIDIDLPYAPHDPGIVLQNGQFNGRYILPARTNMGRVFNWDSIFNGVLISDDKGKNWRAGGLSQSKVGEASVVELSDGSIHLNNRNHDDKFGIRNHAISYDGGESFTKFGYDTELIEPTCDAGMISFEDDELGHIVLFSNPAVKAKKRWDGDSRREMSVRLSLDDGKTWPYKRLIYAGPAAYSGLTKSKNGNIFLVYEHGDSENKTSRQNLSIARFNVQWLMQQEVLPPKINPDTQVFHKSTLVELTAEDSAKIYYCLNEESLDKDAKEYHAPLEITQTTLIKTLAKKEAVSSISLTKKYIKSNNPPLKYLHSYHSKYPASGAMALVDGIKGSSHSYSNWQGFEGIDIDVIIDMEDVVGNKRIELTFLNDQNAWIFPPEKIEVFISKDGEKYQKIETINNSIKPSELEIEEFELQISSSFRYLRIKAKNIGICPEWHKGNGSKAWLFADEIVIE